LLLIGTFIVPKPPAINSSAVGIQNYFVDHRTGARVSVYLLGVAVALFVWFLGGVRTHLRRAEGDNGRLAAVAFGGGLVTLAIFGVGLMVNAALVFSASTGSPATTQALFDIFAVNLPITSFALIPLAGAVAVVGLRHRALPTWLGAAFGVFTVYEFVEGATFSASRGAFAPFNALNIIGLIAFAILTFLLSLVLIQRAGKLGA